MTGALRNISYGELEEQKLDLYFPEGKTKATVVYIHGGGLESGSKEDCEQIARDLIRAGYLTVLVNYRMYPTAVYPQFIEDCAKAVCWCIEHADAYGFGKIYVGGSSAGAYISGMLCFDRKYLSAYGVVPELISGFILDAGQTTTHYNVLRERGVDSRRCIVDEAAILYHICDERPARPLLILYADRDIPCRPEQNLLLCATLRHFGYDEGLISTREMKGFGHCQYDSDEDEQGRNLLAGEILRWIQ